MKRKSIVEVAKPKLIQLTTQPIHITKYNDGYVVCTTLPNGEQLSIGGKDWHYMMARFYNKIRRSYFVANKEVIEYIIDGDRPK